jgi:hypothetical protein
MPTVNGVGKVGWRQAPPKYLLDAFPGAAIAFSMRRLNSAYTGPVIRIRRASDNAEMDINFIDSSVASSTAAFGQLKDTINESEIVNFCGANQGFIVRIYDQSGNGNHLNQTVAASQTLIYTNSGNGTSNLYTWLWGAKAGVGKLSGKLPIGIGYNLTNPIQTDNNWSVFNLASGTGFGSRLSLGTSNTSTLMSTWAIIDGGWRAGSKTKYYRSNGQYAGGGGSDPLIYQIYGKPAFYTTINSNDTLTASVNNNTINFTSVLASPNSGIFDQITGAGRMYELILFNSDKTAIKTDIENAILANYATSWANFIV